MRKSWDVYWMEVAHKVATRATCPRKSVGAVLVKNNQIVSTGYNGSPRRLPHCGCRLEKDNQGNNHCMNVIHAEHNAVLHAGKESRGCTLYVTYIPCSECMKVILQAGITRIVYNEGNIDERREYWYEQAEKTGVQIESNITSTNNLN